MSKSERRRIVRAALTKYDKGWIWQYNLRFVVAPFVTLVASFLYLFFVLYFFFDGHIDDWKSGIIISSVCLSFLATYLADRWLRNDARLPKAVQTYLDLDYEASALITGGKSGNNTPDKDIATLNKAKLESPNFKSASQAQYDLLGLKGLDNPEQRRIFNAAMNKYDKWWAGQTLLLTVVVPFVVALIGFNWLASFWDLKWPEYWFIGVAVVSLCLFFVVAGQVNRWMFTKTRLSKAVQTYLEYEALAASVNAHGHPGSSTPVAFNFKSASQAQCTREFERIAKVTGDDRVLNATGRELAYLPAALSDNEVVLAFAAGNYRGHTCLTTLTDRRIIVLDKGIWLGLKQVALDLDKINTVTAITGIAFGKLLIEGNTISLTIDQMVKKPVAAFANKVSDAIDARKSATRQEPVPQIFADDVVTKLERLAALHEKGALSREEFNQQKAKLMG